MEFDYDEEDALLPSAQDCHHSQDCFDNPQPSAPEYYDQKSAGTSNKIKNGKSWQSMASDILSEHFSEGSIRGSVFNLCSATLGAGCLSLPYALKCAGIGLGIGMLAIGAAATIFSIHLLVLVRTRTNLNSYEAVSRVVFGATVGLFVECCVILFCFGTAVAYCKTLRDFLAPVLNLITQQLTDRQAICIVWLVLLFPLSLIKSVNALRFSSLFGVLTIVYMVIAVGAHSIESLASGRVIPQWSHRQLWINYSLSEVMEAVPIIMFAFTCQVNVFGIFDELQRASRKRMSKVTYRAMGLCMAIYVAIGVLGCLEFGQRTPGNLLLAYDQEMLHGSAVVAGMYIAMTLTLIMAFPLVVLPMRTALDSIARRAVNAQGPSRPSVDCVMHVIWTALLSGGALALSLWVDDVSAVFQVVGGTTSALVCFVLPPACALRLPYVPHPTIPGASAYQPLFPLCSFTALAAAVLAIMGAVLGAWSTSVCIMQLYHYALHAL